MKNTIKATVGEIISYYSRANGTTEDQRMWQCAEAIKTRAGVGPAQLEAVHVYLAACRVLEQRRTEMRAAADGMDEIRAEAAWDSAHSAWIEAQSYLMRLCENIEVEVSHAV